ncbi:B-4DMT family transporter [Rhodococcus sp. NPDC049939]|uniref:B-4DMT family transporter n=1 Tax=Rhodococcus sp. NPDC049939 TaxID=3155511 RepID=UPI003406DE1B
MNAWVVRGLGMALIHVLVRVILGFSITHWPLLGSPLRWLSLAIVVVAALVWAGMDGIRDRRENPDPADGADLTILWLKAAILGGIVAGFGSWLIDVLPFLNVTQNSFFFELTSGAAFTVLLIFAPAMLAVFLGRYYVRRESGKSAENGDSSPVAAGTDAPTEQIHVQPTGTEFSGSDAETTVFERVQEYHGAAYEPDSPETPDDDYAEDDKAEEDRVESEDTASQDPVDPNEHPAAGKHRTD